MTSMRIPAGLYFHGAEAVPAPLASLDDAPDDAAAINFRRIRRYRGGLSRFTGLRELWAQAVDQDFLDDIARAPSLERVYVSQLTATDLSPLARLPRMTRLRINGATRMSDLEWAAPLRGLDVLALEHLPKVRSLEPLAALTQLRSLGVEGAMDSTVRVASLAPLSALTRLEYLFLTALRSDDRSLRPLHALRALKGLECARHFPDAEFVALRSALPELQCRWFDMLDAYPTLAEGTRSAVRRMVGSD
jgi:hypothetical protein